MIDVEVLIKIEMPRVGLHVLRHVLSEFELSVRVRFL